MRATLLVMILMLFGCGDAEEESVGELSPEELEAIRGLLPKIDRILSAVVNEEVVALPLDADFLDRVLAAKAEQDRVAPITEATLEEGGVRIMEKRTQIASRHGFVGRDDLLVAELRVLRTYYYGVLEQHGHVPPTALRDEIDLVRGRHEEVRRVLRLSR